MADRAPLLRGAALGRAAVVCVLIHGRGQSPDVMEESVVSRLAAPEAGFVLPRATGGSWYNARAVDPLTPSTEEQLAHSLLALRAVVETVPRDVPLVIAGFSQGACLAMEYAFRFGPWHGALVCFTGCRVGVATDRRPRAMLGGLPVYLSGGDTDSWIPVSAFAAAVSELGEAGARLRADVFPGRPHEVSDAEIGVLQVALTGLAGGRGAGW